jgi:hypothetical protein
VANKKFWKSCLKDLGENIIPFSKVAWRVNNVVARRIIDKVVEYEIVWKGINGRTFKK